jgi:hypothetical protein
MVRNKSILTEERDKLIDQAVLDVNSKKYKSAYEAEKILGLPKSSVTRRVNGIKTSTSTLATTETFSCTREGSS